MKRLKEAIDFSPGNTRTNTSFFQRMQCSVSGD